MRDYQPAIFVASPDFYWWANRHPLFRSGRGFPFGMFFSHPFHQVYCLN